MRLGVRTSLFSRHSLDHPGNALKNGSKYRDCQGKSRSSLVTVEFTNDYVLGFIICGIFTVITLQDWVGWGIFAVIPGYPRGANGDSQHLEARTELQDLLRFELFTVKKYRTRPFSK